ncbi:hypothetical protein GFC01_03895 [Desulfofundulus thermobenzoicus]|uniref:Flagellar biosynthesis protein FlhF n=1 Tax=Desulfofundulus thermobenzoicus TaxID=29376 RepID=A0A6N7IPB5_9FIRM|nr:hypothetical protein [Desulfofundulus thermobenzoicus]
MKIKKYVVREMQEAMRLIKEDLGPDAVIISSYRLPRKNILDFFRPVQLEVTAAMDELPPGPAPAGSLPPGGANYQGLEQLHSGPPMGSRPGAPPAARFPDPPPAPGRLHAPAAGRFATACAADGYPARSFGGGYSGETMTLERSRTSNAAGRAGSPPLPPGEAAGDTGENIPMYTGPEKEENNPSPFNIILKKQEELLMNGDVTDQWRRHLLDGEVEAALVDELLQDLVVDAPGADREDLLGLQLTKRISSLVRDAYRKVGDGGGICAFIGPTGVGKTTTLAKLATRRALLEGKNIALVAVYSHRFGVVEELKFYGQNMGVPVEVVMTPAELAAAVEAHRDRDALYIDTEGISCRNAGQLLKLKGFLDVLPPETGIYLVLSATTRNRDLLHAAGEFARAGYSQIIFTKLDETRTRGGALNLVHRTGRPVAYITTGQNVPDDLVPVTPRKLAALLLEGGEDGVGPDF